LAAAAQPRRDRPNIIVFYVDELRATALRLHNPDGVATPNLARLAHRGVTFDHAFTPYPLCQPARVSLWSGQYPHTHGSRHNQNPMADRVPSMAAVLRDAGYTLGIFGKNHCFQPAQLDRWFTANLATESPQWRQSLSPEEAAANTRLQQWIAKQGGPMMPPMAAPFPPEAASTHLINQRAMDFIERRRGDPFALWISIIDPHNPIQVPERFAHAMPPEKLQLPPQRPGAIRSQNSRMRIYDYLTRGSELTEDYLRRYLSIYYGMVAFIDHELGRLLALLERRRLLERTILVFTTDHGDFAAEHHLLYKTGSLVDSMVHVPLILSWPGQVPEGRRETALVNQIDIMPTLLRLCGLEIPKGVEGRQLPLRPGDPARSFVYSEYGNGEPEYTWEQAKKIGPPERLGDYPLQTEEQLQHLYMRERAGHLEMIRTQTHKLIRDSNGDVEFYDLVKDPYELDNIHGRPAYRAAEAQLATYFSQV
jgi:arylsulfatase A-like enzyme